MYKNSILLNDIYYSKDYASLYLKEGEELFEFKCKEQDKIFYNISIKRPIKKIGNTFVNGYYDLETAYGYGGFYCNTDDKKFIKKSLLNYQNECKKNNIIAEFTRFHPFNEFHINNKKYFDFIADDRETIYVDLKQDKENRWLSYSSKIRTILRKCERELRLEKSEDIESFMILYYHTMDRNNANNYYYFGESYFRDLINTKNIELYNAYKDNVLVASSFFLFSADFAHYHLSANNYEYRKYNANYFILDNIFEIGHQKGIKIFHLGGGRTKNCKYS